MYLKEALFIDLIIIENSHTYVPFTRMDHDRSRFLESLTTSFVEITTDQHFAEFSIQRTNRDFRR